MFRGNVQRVEHGNVILTIGKAEAVLPRREQVGGETYRFGDQIFVYVTDVRQSFRGPSITVSRTHPGLVRQLFTLEVPEISDGIVELKNVSREAGQRTKIAVYAENQDVDPVGACVGPRGTRVGRVVDELGREKVDIVRWNEDPVSYISNALSPAQISKVILKEDPTPGPAIGTATVIVSEDQQSLAIGKQGQNVRLAARLTGWRIDIRTEKQYAEEQAAKMFREEEEHEGDDDSKITVVENLDATSKLFSVDEDMSGEVSLSEVAENEVAADEAGSTPDPEAEVAPVENENAPAAESEVGESEVVEVAETENLEGDETKAE